MVATVVKVEGSEVALEGPQGTTVNITLRQESGLAYLCKGVAALAGRKADAQDAQDAPPAPRVAPPRPAGGGEQKVLGGALILLGAVCIGLGVVLSVVITDPLPYYYYREINNGVPFWMGSLFILSGTFSVVGARRGGYWVHLATFLNLGSVVSGSVAFTVGLTEFAPLNYEPYFIGEICSHRSEYRRYPWWATTSPPYDERGQQRCREVLLGFVRLLGSTQILLLIVHVAAMATALFCFGYGLSRLCRSCWGAWQDYMVVEDSDASLAPKEPGEKPILA